MNAPIAAAFDESTDLVAFVKLDDGLTYLPDSVQNINLFPIGSFPPVA